MSDTLRPRSGGRTTKGRLLLVSPRPPRPDGHGDQRRAHDILTALAHEWDVEVISWLPDADRSGLRRWWDRPGVLARAVKLARTHPLQVAYVQARAPQSLAARLALDADYDVAIFITNRAVPSVVPPGSVVDFVDDLGGVAHRRARSSKGLASVFWRWEGRRLQDLDTSIAERAGVAVAHSLADAEGILGRVGMVPLSVGTKALPDDGDRVVFLGNLFYAPNHEAATWICAELAPCLRRLGVEPGRLLIAGRRPRPALRKLAERAGVDLRADVDDLLDVFREAAVVLSPMLLGTGTQYKVLDACGARRPCVLSPVANAGLGLLDGQSALIRDRRPEPFARAVRSLLEDPGLRARLADNAYRHIREYLPDSVGAAWRTAVASCVTKHGELIETCTFAEHGQEGGSRHSVGSSRHGQPRVHRKRSP